MATRLLYNADTWDAATITSSSETGDLVDDNIIHDFIGKPWRTTGDSSEWIKFDLATATKLTCIGIFGHNFTSAATVTLEANATDSWGAPSYSQALTIAVDGDSVVFDRLVFFLDQTYRWWRLTVVDAANPDTYIQIGRIMAGEYYEPPRSVSQGFTIAVMDPSEGGGQAGQQAAYRQQPKYRQAQAAFAFINQTQRDKFEALFRKIGRTEPLILALDPSTRASEDSLYCHLASPLSLAHLVAASYNVGRFTFEEKVV